MSNIEKTALRAQKSSEKSLDPSEPLMYAMLRPAVR